MFYGIKHEGEYEPKAKHRVHPPIMEIGEAAPKIRPVNHPEPAHAGKRHTEARFPGKALLDAMKGRESRVGRVVPADLRTTRRGDERNVAVRGTDRRDIQKTDHDEVIH